MSDNKNQFGQQNWDDVNVDQTGGGGGGFTKDKYLRLDNGTNEIRFVSRPHQYLVHNYKEEGDSGFGKKILCSSFHKSCPLCALKDRPKRRWLAAVIDRKTSTVQILDMSVSVFKAVQDLSREEDYGNPERYDINIKVNKQGGATGYYNVIPKPPKPMSANDLELKSQVDLERLLFKCTPPTPEKVAELLEKYHTEKGGASAPAFAKSNPAKKTSKHVDIDMNGSTEEDFVFKQA